MTTIIVSSGQFQSNFTVSSGVFVDISSGGAASGDIILTGGTMTVFNGGSAVATQFAASAGTLIVASGGIAQNTLFSSDAASSTEIIQSGGMSIDTSVGDFFGVSGQFGDGGERVLIESGGIASATTINWYGSQIVSAGGSVLATLIQGGAQQILSGGIATGTVIEQSDKESFGIHQSAITSFGSQIIAAGGHADNSVIQSGGVEIVSAGGFTSATQIRTGGIEKIESGANVTSLTLLGGGAIDFAALAFTQSGSASIDSATDLLTVTEGAHSATLQLAGTYQSGFDLHLSSDGNNGTMLSATENSIVISSGFTASGLSIGEGQATNLLQILSGGSAIFNSIISNGVMQVFGGGTSVDDVVFTGGQEILLGGEAMTAILSGGELIVSGGSAIDTNALSGEIIVNNGGTDLSATLGGSFSNSQELIATEVIFSGGIDSASTLGDGYINVSSGGIAIDTTNDQGLLTVSNGGTSISATIFASLAQETVTSGGLASATTITDGGTLSISNGGTAIGAILTSNGIMTAASGAMLENTSVVAGTLTLSAGATAIGTIIDHGGTEYLTSGAFASATIINSGGTIDLAGVAYSSNGTFTFNSATDLLTITENSVTRTVHLAGTYTSASFHLASGDPLSSDTFITVTTSQPTPCFAEGTKIRTTIGEIPVESLTDSHYLPTKLSNHPRRIRWLGHRRTNVAAHPNPDDVRPVRILKAAFAPDAPIRDLILSPHHAIYHDGALIPIRHLINGATIIQESIDKITYYHIELADDHGNPIHDIITAENLALESFLETGNRGAFENADSPLMLHPDFVGKIWQTKACAPLLQSGPKIAALRTKLQSQIESNGFNLTKNPAPILQIGNQFIAPVTFENAYRFALPHTTTHARLLSRRFVPAQLRPDQPDEQSYGLAVSAIALDHTNLPLTDPRLKQGWHTLELSHRWTNGDAVIDCTGASILSLKIRSGCLYWGKIGQGAETKTA